jgi:hypothetical protein
MRFPSLWQRSERAPACQSLPFPAGPNLRAALAGNSGRLKDVVTFPENRWRALPSFAPQVLAGELPFLLRLANHIFDGTLEIPSLDVALFVLTRLGENPLLADQRNMLWRAFRVPVYELYVDESNTVLAAECEAHEGWHVRHPRLKFNLRSRELLFQKHGLAANPLQTGLMADGLDSICACGNDAPLLRHVRTTAPAIQPAKKAGRRTAALTQTAPRRRAATA